MNLFIWNTHRRQQQKHTPFHLEFHRIRMPGILFTSQGRKPLSLWTSSTHLLYCTKSLGERVLLERRERKRRRVLKRQLRVLFASAPRTSSRERYCQGSQTWVWQLLWKRITPVCMQWSYQHGFSAAGSGCTGEGRTSGTAARRVRRGRGTAAWSRWRRTEGDRGCRDKCSPF